MENPHATVAFSRYAGITPHSAPPSILLKFGKEIGGFSAENTL
jgi:hypothetical protein